MSTELERVPHVIRASDMSPLRITGFDQAKQMSEFLAKASVVPEAYRGKPADILIAIGMGAELGLGPFQSLQSIYVVHGRPALYVEAALAIVLATGLLETYKTDANDEEAVCVMRRRGVAEPLEIRFTFQEATSLQLTRNQNWSTQRRWMLETRAIGRALHRLFPDVLKGLGVVDLAGPVEQGAALAPEPIDVKDRLRAKLAAERPAPEPAPEPEPGDEPPPAPAPPPAPPDVKLGGPSDQELTMKRGQILHDMDMLGLTPAMQTIFVKRHAGVNSIGELGRATLDGLIALQEELDVQKNIRHRLRPAP
jgi:hypothetical protein